MRHLISRNIILVWYDIRWDNELIIFILNLSTVLSEFHFTLTAENMRKYNLFQFNFGYIMFYVDLVLNCKLPIHSKISMIINEVWTFNLIWSFDITQQRRQFYNIKIEIAPYSHSQYLIMEKGLNKCNFSFLKKYNYLRILWKFSLSKLWLLLFFEHQFFYPNFQLGTGFNIQVTCSKGNRHIKWSCQTFKNLISFDHLTLHNNVVNFLYK